MQDEKSSGDEWWWWLHKMWMYLMSLNYTLRMVKIVNYMLYVYFDKIKHNFKKYNIYK